MKNTINICRFLLILLWVYAAASKLLSLEQSRVQMLNQVFPVWIAEILVWLVPAVELLTVLLLFFPSMLEYGLKLSAVLLLTFSLYAAVVMTGVFGRIPCSCGGVIDSLAWGHHLLLNLFFLAMTVTAYLSLTRELASESQ